MTDLADELLELLQECPELAALRDLDPRWWVPKMALPASAELLRAVSSRGGAALRLVLPLWSSLDACAKPPPGVSPYRGALSAWFGLLGLELAARALRGGAGAADLEVIARTCEDCARALEDNGGVGFNPSPLWGSFNAETVPLLRLVHGLALSASLTDGVARAELLERLRLTIEPVRALSAEADDAMPF